MKNCMKLEIRAISLNEAFARSAVAAFALPLEPTLTELSDIKTAVSEAVTNCIVHAYNGGSTEQRIYIECSTDTDGECGTLHIRITDQGCGIEDVDRALTPFFTTLADEERSGMGFTIMESFMDKLTVRSKLGKGTTVTMKKTIKE